MPAKPAMNASFETEGRCVNGSIEMQTANRKFFVDLDADPDAPLSRYSLHAPQQGGER